MKENNEHCWKDEKEEETAMEQQLFVDVDRCKTEMFKYYTIFEVIVSLSHLLSTLDLNSKVQCCCAFYCRLFFLLFGFDHFATEFIQSHKGATTKSQINTNAEIF